MFEEECISRKQNVSNCKWISFTSTLIGKMYSNLFMNTSIDHKHL